MAELGILDLYEKADENKINSFLENKSSSLSVRTDYQNVEVNTEWIEKMEITVPYLDNILRNPNRFIINEEDVVKIELARRVTVESIKHLSRNTNLIQEIDKKTGDVKPSKILNINKEESYDTYENRFIYSLIQNMMFYLEKQKRNLNGVGNYKNNKNLMYNANANLNGENVNVSLSFDSKTISSGKEAKQNDELLKRLSKLELSIKDLTQSEVYKSIARLHISLVTSPIKKTNVILKNVNFQYALQLWNYLQNHPNDSIKQIASKKSFEDDSHLKRYIDESILLDYLVADTINKQEQEVEVNREKVVEQIASAMVKKMMNVKENLTEDELSKIVGKMYSVTKYKSIENDGEIIKRFKTYIDKYLEQIEDVRI